MTSTAQVKQILSEVAQDLTFEFPWTSISFSPINRILSSTEDVDPFLDYLEDYFADKIVPGSLEGIGYLIDVRDNTNVRPCLLLTVLYALLVTNADIYVPARMVDGEYYDTLRSDYGLGNVWDLLIRSYPSAAAVEFDDGYGIVQDSVRDLRGRHPNIRHVIVLGDFLNVLHRAYVYRQSDLVVHLPTARLIVTDYSHQGAHINDVAKIEAINELVHSHGMDYWAFRSPQNRCEIYDVQEFDYADLLEDANDVIETVHSHGLAAEPIPTLVLTDRTRDALDLPACANECCRVVLSRDYHPGEEYYDFAAL